MFDRIGIEDKERLEELTQSELWKLFLKYSGELTKPAERRLIEADAEKDDLVRLKGQVEGAKEVRKMLEEFKNYIKATSGKV